MRFLKRRLDTPARPAGWPIPQWYYLDIGNVCNLRCPYCPTGNGATPESQKGLMSRESFDRILPQLEKHARFVCLFNWGEPWVNKHLLYMVRALADRGIDTHLDSNLSVRDFSDRDAEAVVRSGLFSLFASIDGVSQAAYEKYRVGGRVDRALGNLRQLAEARRRLGSETPGLIWAFYLNRHNEASVCRQPFTVGVIQWNGDVFPCCAVAGDEFKLGNVLEQSFEEVWNDAPLSACRSFLKNFGPVQGGGSVCEVVCTAVPSHA